LLLRRPDASARQYPLIDPSRDYTPQRDYIINIQPLSNEINKLADAFGRDSISIYIEFLNTGANISINPSLYLWPASLPKVPIAMAVVKKIEKGDWRYSNELILMPQDKDDKSGDEEDSLWEHPVGTRFTIEVLLEELLKNSDNTAQRILYRNLHADEIDDVVVELGVEKLFDEEGKMSAKEYSRLFRSLYTASYLTRENSQKLLTYLDASPHEQFLAGSVPDDVPFPHKYGENVSQRAYADAGIVYFPNRPYLITVMVQGNPELDIEEDRNRAAQLMQQISKEAYEYFLNK